MLSRAESIDDAYIAGAFKPEKIQCIEAALNETKRLEEKSLTNIQYQCDTICFCQHPIFE